MTQRTPRPGQRSLRKGRHSEAGRLYHVTAATDDRKPLFLDHDLGRAMVNVWRRLDGEGASRTLAFVIMPDHVHWLFALGEAIDLSKLIDRFKAASARQVNRLRGTAGSPVWQRGYYDHALRRDEDVRAVARYIIANPVRAGLVASVRNYPLWDAAWL